MLCFYASTLYTEVLCGSVNNNRKHAIAYAHFLYHSLLKAYLSKREVDTLYNSMPLVDNYGSISKIRKGVLVPAKISGSLLVSLLLMLELLTYLIYLLQLLGFQLLILH